MKKKYYKLTTEINNGRLVPVNGRFPEGTVMAREVKLIKKIWG